MNRTNPVNITPPKTYYSSRSWYPTSTGPKSTLLLIFATYAYKGSGLETFNSPNHIIVNFELLNHHPQWWLFIYMCAPQKNSCINLPLRALLTQITCTL